MAQSTPAPFVGSYGEDWTVRPAMFGPPDNVNDTQLQWLIAPGPPVSCYVSFVLPRQDPRPMEFYHSHDESWSVHIVLSGAGQQFVEGVAHDVGPGSVLYHAPKVRHSLVPLPNQPLVHVVVQHPAAGWVRNAVTLHPEAGTARAFGDIAAFVSQFGDETGEKLRQHLAGEHRLQSERWKTFVVDRGKVAR